MSFLKLEQNLYLNNSVKFSQYLIDDKLLTIIGEIHNEFYDDSKVPIPNLYISSLIKKYFNNSLILLEIGKYTDISKSVSLNIEDINKNILSESIRFEWRPIDMRHDYIIKDYINILYYTDLYLSFNLLDFMTIFFQPIDKAVMKCYEKINLFSLTKDQKLYLNYFIENIKNDKLFLIKQFIEPINSLLIENDNKVSIGQYLSLNLSYTCSKTGKKYTFLKILQILWNKFTDFEIMLTVFTSQNKNIICIIGGIHAENINDILGNFKIFSPIDEADYNTRRKLNYTNLIGMNYI